MNQITIHLEKEVDGNMDAFDYLEHLANQSLLLLIKVVLIALPFVIIFLLLKRKAKLGSLKLATRKHACGIIFGVILTWTGPKVVYSPINDEGSCIIWGTSGTGKTSAILINTMNSISGVATTFCIDISGDIESKVYIKNKIVFGPNAENSAAYNVFAPVDKIYRNKNLPSEERINRTIEQIEKLANQIIPEMGPDDGDGAVVFYNNGGHDILLASLLAGYFSKLDFVDICLKIHKNNWKQLFSWIDDSGITEASDLLGQFEKVNEENTGGCMSKAKTAIKTFISYSARRFLHRPHENELCYTPNKLETNSVFYIVNDGNDFKLYAPLTKLVISQTMEYLENRKVSKDTHMILMALDEYSSLNMADETSAAAKKYRKKRVRLLICTQSIADMDLMTRAGNTQSKATIDNFPFRMVLGAQDPDSQTYFARCVGKHDVYYKDSQGNTSKPVKEYWIEPEYFGRLDKHLVLIHPKGHMVLGKNYHYKWMIEIIIGSILDFSIFKWGMH